jgi:dipeptidyl aminopeptidase/acylaminoacyl peptidase
VTSRLIGLAAFFLLVTSTFVPLHAGGDVTVQPDVIYGRKDGMALTFDVLTPKEPNGAGVLFIQSGGWYSVWREPKTLLPASMPLLNKGFTVFIVYHGSSPKYNLTEATQDVRRAVRFIRLHAKDYGVDPERLGALGGSAGGHLSLMLATTADDGDPNAKDEVLTQSNRIAAAVAFYPPTDLRKWTTDPPEAIKKLPQLKPSLTFDSAREADFSPLLHVTPDDAAIMLIHGDKDQLVPISHSNNMIEALEKGKLTSKLVVIEGAAHGFNAKQNMIVIPAMVGWFETQLKAEK